MTTLPDETVPGLGVLLCIRVPPTSARATAHEINDRLTRQRNVGVHVTRVNAIVVGSKFLDSGVDCVSEDSHLKILVRFTGDDRDN